MWILSRYIALSWLRLLLICQSSFVSVYLVLDMMDKIPRFIKAGGAGKDIVQFFLCKVPEMVGQTASFSLLMTTLLTLGFLSKNSEIIAMRSCGISLFRIALPMLALGFAGSLLLLVNAELVIPSSYDRMELIERTRIKKQGVNAVFRRNNIWFRSDRQIVQAQLFEAQKRALVGLTIWNLDDNMTPVSRIDAEKAVFERAGWRLYRLEQKEFLPAGGYRTTRFPAMDMQIGLKIEDLKILDNNADNFSYRKLREYAESLQKGGYQASRYLTMMHAKLSSPFAAFVMVILGIPFAIRNTRSGGVALGIGASVGIGFAYFVVNAVLLSYGRSGVLPAMVAAWGSNVLFCLGGIWLALTVRR